MKITFWKMMAACAGLGLMATTHTTNAATPTTAAGFFEMYQNRNDASWSGSDQGTSFRASNGVNYWVHADTILGTQAADGSYNDGWRMIGNSILREKDGTLVNATAAPLAVPDPADAVPNKNERYWLQGMFEANGSAYFLAQRVRHSEGGMGFTLVGNSFAKFRFEPGGDLTFLKMVDSPTTGLEGSSYRAALSSGGYVYVYGTGGANDPGGSWVQRARAENVENPASWESWKGGTTWAPGLDGRAKVRDNQVESVHVINGKWVLLYKPYGAKSAYTNVGDGPTGPFVENWAFDAPFFKLPNGRDVQTYCAQLHPEYPLASGKFLASIAYNSDLFNAVAKDADLYKLRFFEVDIPGVPAPTAPIAHPGAR